MLGDKCCWSWKDIELVHLCAGAAGSQMDWQWWAWWWLMEWVSRRSGGVSLHACADRLCSKESSARGIGRRAFRFCFCFLLFVAVVLGVVVNHQKQVSQASHLITWDSFSQRQDVLPVSEISLWLNMFYESGLKVMKHCI